MQPPRVYNNTTATADLIIENVKNGGQMPNTARDIRKVYGLPRTSAEETWRLVRWYFSRSSGADNAAVAGKVTPKDIEKEVKVRAAALAAQKIEALRSEIYKELTKDVDGKIKFAENYRPYIFDKNYALSQAEYNILFKCLHPDVIARFGDEALTERFTEAFRILKEKKTKLMLPDRFPAQDKAPPRKTVEEYMADLAAKRAEAAKRAAATRKARQQAANQGTQNG